MFNLISSIKNNSQNQHVMLSFSSESRGDTVVVLWLQNSHVAHLTLLDCVDGRQLVREFCILLSISSAWVLSMCPDFRNTRT